MGIVDEMPQKVIDITPTSIWNIKKIGTYFWKVYPTRLYKETEEYRFYFLRECDAEEYARILNDNENYEE
jgi:hypothetical protein